MKGGGGSSTSREITIYHRYIETLIANTHVILHRPAKQSSKHGTKNHLGDPPFFNLMTPRTDTQTEKLDVQNLSRGGIFVKHRKQPIIMSKKATSMSNPGADED